MSKPIRISDELYQRLEILTQGFETPNETILRIVKNFEYQKIYDMVNPIVKAKLDNIESENLKVQNANILMHYNPETIKAVMKDICDEHKGYNIAFQIDNNSLSVDITVK